MKQISAVLPCSIMQLKPVIRRPKTPVVSETIGIVFPGNFEYNVGSWRSGVMNKINE